MILRSLLFYLFFLLWTAALSILCAPLLLGTPRIVAITGHLWSAGTMLLLRLCCAIRFEVQGKEHLPPSPFIIASKHQSTFETIILNQLLPAPIFVLKKELLCIPFFGQYLRCMNMIVLDRDGRVDALKELIRQAGKKLQAKQTIIIFPEGTRTLPHQRGAYHPGIAALYALNQVPVVPVALNSGLYWEKHSFIKKPGTIIIEFLPPIASGLTREAFMSQLESSIEEASTRLLPRIST